MCTQLLVWIQLQGLSLLLREGGDDGELLVPGRAGNEILPAAQPGVSDQRAGIALAHPQV